MKSAKVAAQFLLLNVLLSIGANSGSAAQAKYSPTQRGGQAAQQMNSRGSQHLNHKWSADPERGWVRGDDTHDVNDQRSVIKRQNKNKPQQIDRKK